MHVSQILPGKPADVVGVEPSATVRVAIALMKQRRVGSVLVLEQGNRLLGVLSERDVVHALASDLVNPLDRPVGDFARSDGPTASPHDTVQSVMEIMTATRARHVPVIQFGQVVGILSIGDIVKSCLNEKIQENAVLQEIARAHYFAN
jgi:CBS domain-containing protein